MDLTISGRHVDVTDAMRQHARDRLRKLEKYSHHLMSANVTLAIEGERHIAEIVARVRSRGDLVAKRQTHDMYSSIDQAAAKLETQLHKIEDRFKHHRDSARQKRSPEVVAEPEPQTDQEEYPEDAE